MRMRSVVRGIGFAFIIWGSILALFSSVSITGLSIVEDVGIQARSIMALVFLIFGLVLAGAAQKLRVNTSKTIDDFIGSLHVPPTTRRTVVLPDSSFIAALNEGGYQPSKSFFGSYDHLLLKPVEYELSRPRAEKHGAALVPQSTLRYYTSPNQLNTRVSEYEPSEHARRTVMSIYRDVRPKGPQLSKEQEFETGADLPLLCYAIDHPHEDVIVLTRDSDMDKLVPRIPRHSKQSIRIIKPSDVM